ncbi:MAG: TolC family protein [Bacteroidales bacterium]|nr:TolC family protein [Bacteroidales bacterium]MBN2763222.1 TolC family protein [Bacteroidales bacterium]
MKKIFFLFLAVLFFTNAYPQKKWSLEECINYAYENNLQIKRQELNVQYNKNNYSQSYFNILPNLNGSLNHGYSSGKYTFQGDLYENNAWSGSAQLNSRLTLFSGLQTLNEIKQKKYLFLQSQSDLMTRKNIVSIELANGYLQVLFSKELLEVAKNKLEVTSMQSERTKKLLDVGNVAQGEYLQIKAQEANDKTSLINTQNSLDIAVLNLTQLLDLDSSGGFDIVVPQQIEIELISPLETVEEIYAKALENMPQIKSAEYALKSSEKQLAITRGMASPSIGLNSGISSEYKKDIDGPEAAPYFDQLKDNNMKHISVGMTVPIFNQLQVKNSISNAKLNMEDYKVQLDQTKMALYKEVQQAHADAKAAREKYYSSVEAVNYNEEAFKYTSQKLEVGLVNSVDYNIAQNNLIAAKSSMLQAKYEYIFKLKILDLYMGNPIVL